MELFLLRASDGTPLSKTYEELAPGQYREEAYPHVLKFDSLSVEISDLSAMFNALCTASEEQLCLVKGSLRSKLVGESRAGQTDSHEKTSWICLDIDTEVKNQTPAQFLDALAPELADVSFIFQHSASTGIKTAGGWRGHIFMLLATPTAPQVLKKWLTHLNFTKLDNQITLAASGVALRFPLDVTTCQNDKLIYVAAPTCLNFENPVPERFQLVERGKPAIEAIPNISATLIQQQTTAKVKSLRASSNLEAKSIQLKRLTDGQEVLLNPDPMTITGVKEARGFVYLNINDGDSWAYYFPMTNPEVVWNFKGEPAVYLKDLDPELYAKYSGARFAESSDAVAPLVFRWRSDDLYYNGFYNATTGELICLNSTNSKAKLKDFLIQHGTVPDKTWTVPDWELVFDPTADTGKVDFAQQRVNVYAMPRLLADAVATGGFIPPTIQRVLDSVCVDDVTQEYFLNWLAYIFQTRRKTATAWIFQGVEGTGKGVLFTHIIAPLIGRDYCHEITLDRFDDQFNAYLERNIVLFIDEANISDSLHSEKTVNKLKNLITEDVQVIRRMRSNPVTMTNYTNVILASNHDEIMPLSVTDRRYNVAPRQETPLPLEYQDILAIRDELPDFANFLKARQVDEALIKRVMNNDARNRLIELSKTSLDHFFAAVHAGDLEYFVQYLRESAVEDDYLKFQLVVDRWIAHVGTPMKVSREDLRTCYQYIQQSRIAPAKFSRICAKYHLEIRTVRIGGSPAKGVDNVCWQLDPEILAGLKKQRPAAKVVNLKENISG